MRGAMFDLDGTLADTAPDLVGALNDLLAAEGAEPIPYETARRTAGRGGRALIALGFGSAGASPTPERIEELLPRFLDLYAGRLTRESRLFGGVEASLDALAADGWRLGVCTNKPHALATRFLEEIGIADRFAAVFGADAVPARKPDAGHLFATIDAAGADRARSVLIGDTITDRDAARNASTPVVLATFGYALEPMTELAPDATFSAFAELPALLNRLIPA